MAVEWREYLAVGVREIDNQHKELFNKFNLFLQACDEGKGPEEVSTMLDFLDCYVVEHFATEERLQSVAGFPGYEEHRAHHRYFIDELAVLKRQAQGTERNLGVVLTTSRLLVGWLIEHISKLDKAFGRFLKETQSVAAAGKSIPLPGRLRSESDASLGRVQ